MINPLHVLSRMYANWQTERRELARIRREDRQIVYEVDLLRAQQKLQAGLRREAEPFGPTSIRNLALPTHDQPHHSNLTIRQRQGLAQYDIDAAAGVRERNGPVLHTINRGAK